MQSGGVTGHEAHRKREDRAERSSYCDSFLLPPLTHNSARAKKKFKLRKVEKVKRTEEIYYCQSRVFDSLSLCAVAAFLQTLCWVCWVFFWYFSLLCFVASAERTAATKSTTTTRLSLPLSHPLLLLPSPSSCLCLSVAIAFWPLGALCWGAFKCSRAPAPASPRPFP